MSWRPLAEFRDRKVGKIHRLARAEAKGLEVPPTSWAWMSLPLERVELPPGMAVPVIVRSASSEEDRSSTTAAGKFESVVVPAGGAKELRDACRRVLSSMGGQGHVFCQPLMESVLGAEPEAAASGEELRGGVLFFDGFFYERTEALGHNRDLTSGAERGRVMRGDLVRGDPFCDWLRRVARVFKADLRGAGALDVEYVRQGSRHVLLQARPARFAVRRNPILSLANHREILGELPSPWIVDALCLAGEGALAEFARVDPAVGTWGARYAEAHGGRAWLSFSFFFRLMDHWGLPRTFVTEGVGGDPGSRADGKADLVRMVAKSPRLIRLQLQNRTVIRQIPEGLAELDRHIDGCRSVADWFSATARALDLALRTNFAINGALSGAVRVRRALRIRGRARVVTESMMEEYEAIRHLDRRARGAALSDWLERFGHRGPLESDPMQPRFAEMETVLLSDLMGPGPADPSPSASSPPESGNQPAPTRAKTGWWFRLDRIREDFRDELMRRWVKLRRGALRAAQPHAAAGDLPSAQDVFLLAESVLGQPDQWPTWIRETRARRALQAKVRLPLTARLDEIEDALNTADDRPPAATGGVAAEQWKGIGIGQGKAQGSVVKAADLPDLLAQIERGEREPLGRSTVLLVPALEPSWAILFGRVGAVITDIGGELSHASILLREAGCVAVVNCEGASASLADGASVEVDGALGLVRTLAQSPRRVPHGPGPGT